jgi:hypothetical protein
MKKANQHLGGQWISRIKWGLALEILKMWPYLTSNHNLVVNKSGPWLATAAW